MLNIIKDGPFRHIHSAATGELILTLASLPGRGFFDFDNEKSGCHSLTKWKAIARRRLGDVLITDTDNRN
jgi:hypothetical protein